MNNIFIEDMLKHNMMKYASSLIVDRALPDIRDGLKPVQRRLLWTMYTMKATSFTKCANITGETMKVHPHGDSYGSLVKLIQKDHQVIQPVIGKGNFGAHTSKDLMEAAARYTEAKLSPMILEMLDGIKNNEVNMINNYDNTKKIPEVIPYQYPNILCQNTMGIAVGMASNIPSFNMIEVNEALIKYIQTNTETLLVPDLPTKGFIEDNEEQIKKINYSGTGSLRLRSKYTIKNNTINIIEIPYSTTREHIIDKIVSLIKSNKLKEIVDIKDLTDINGLNIEITCKKNSNIDLVIAKLERLTPMISSINANMNILVNNYPKTLGVWDILKSWLELRRGSIYNRLSFFIEQKNEQLHLLKALKKVLTQIDLTIDIIRKSDNPISILKLTFDLDNTQAEYIYNLKLKNINNKYIQTKLIEVDELEKEIDKLKSQMNDKEIDKIIVKELKNINKKYGQPRQTIIEKFEDRVVANEIIKNEDLNTSYKIVFTKELYLKKLKSLKTSTHKLKEDDEVLVEKELKNNGEILVFVKDGRCIKVKISSIEETNLNTFGVYLPVLLKIPKEDIVGTVFTDNFEGHILIAYTTNRIAKIPLASYKTTTSRRELKNSLN